MICDKWLHIYGNKLGTGVNCEWVDDVRENVKGEWVYEDEYYQDDGTHVVVGYPHCSVCNYVPYHPDDERIDECTPFCPNCGADMRGEA